MTPSDKQVQAQSVRDPLNASHIVGLLFALVLTTIFWVPTIASMILPENLVWRNVAAQCVDWIFAISLILIVLFWERNSLKSFGFKELNLSILATGLGLGGFMMLGIMGWTLLAPFLMSESGIDSATASELPAHFYLWYAPLALITASFAEEIIYRGYAMERLLRLGINPWVTVIITQIAFALYHLKDGMNAVYMVATVGSLFALYYIWTRNLWVTIIGHFFVDAMAVIGQFVSGH